MQSNCMCVRADCPAGSKVNERKARHSFLCHLCCIVDIVDIVDISASNTASTNRSKL